MFGQTINKLVSDKRSQIEQKEMTSNDIITWFNNADPAEALSVLAELDYNNMYPEMFACEPRSALDFWTAVKKSECLLIFSFIECTRAQMNARMNARMNSPSFIRADHIGDHLVSHGSTPKINSYFPFTRPCSLE